MNENKRLIKNTVIIAIGNMGTKLVLFLLLPLYTALLSTNEYGIFDYILSISAFCVPFVSMLMDESIFRFLIDCKEESEKKKVISTSAFIVTIGIVIFMIIAILIMNKLHYRFTYYAIAFILCSVICCMMGALLRGIGRTGQYAAFNFLMGAVQILLNVIFIAVLRLGLAGMLLASIIANLLVSTVFIVKIKLWNFIDFKIVDTQLMKDMIVYSLPLIPNKISWIIINLSDRILIMNMLGSSYVGIYALSNKFPSLMDTIYGFFYQSWKESSARVMGEETQDQFYNTIYGYLKNYMYAVVISMIAFMPLIFKILIHIRYYDAIYYIPILIIAMYFSNISGFFGGIFTAYKDTKIMGITTMVAAFINLIVNFILINMLGLYAAAISTLTASFVVYIYRRFKVRKYVNFYENWKTKIISILITVFVLLAFYSEMATYIVFSCIIATIYAVVVNRKMIIILGNVLLRGRNKGLSDFINR